MPHLRIKSGQNKGSIFDISQDNIKIGRDPNCGIELNENGVSREHAEIYKVGEMYFIRDLGSRNGLTVNENGAKDELLRDGDAIRICSYTLIFESTPSHDEIEEDSFLESEGDALETLTMTVSPHKSLAKIAAKTGEALKKFTPVISQLDDSNTVYDKFLDAVFESLDIQEAYIFILGTGNKLSQKAHRTVVGLKKGKASRSIVLRAIKEKETICTANAQDDFRFKSEDSIVLKNISSVLCAPLMAFGQPYGVVYLNNHSLSKPFNDESSELITQLSTQLALSVMALESKKKEEVIQNRSISLIAHTVELMHDFLKGRAERVSHYCRIIGNTLKLKEAQMKNLHCAAYLHHIGYLKVHLDSHLKLDDLVNEKSYVSTSLEILRENQGFEDAMPLIQYHRYRLDGTGTPSKLPVQSWPIESQILASAIELELRLNLPMFMGEETIRPQNDIMSDFLKEATSIVSKPVIRAVEHSFKTGHLLNL